MANIITNTEVFSFIGATTDQISTHGAEITALITREQKQLESLLGRSVISNSASDLYLENRKNCEIIKDRIFLTGELRDMYEITALSECGTSLTESTAYNDGNDYIFDSDSGIIKKLNDYWSTEYLAIKLSGKYGYVNQSDDSARDDIKQVLIEIVASRSGLWKKTYVSGDGTVVSTERSIDNGNKWLKDLIKNHVNYAI